MTEPNPNEDPDHRRFRDEVLELVLEHGYFIDDVRDGSYTILNEDDETRKCCLIITPCPIHYKLASYEANWNANANDRCNPPAS